MTNKEKKGMYQVKRIRVDIRSAQHDEAETVLNSALIELQQDKNIEIIDVIDSSTEKNIVIFIIKYYDYGLTN